MLKAQSFRDLIVWQKSHKLALEIYRLTKTFPSDEKFGIISQMRRAAVSVPANIAEGFTRRSIKDKSNFYNISQSSLHELEYFLILSKDLGYINNFDLFSSIDEIAKMLHGLISSLTT
jgi:four helix bundle protein